MPRGALLSLPIMADTISEFVPDLLRSRWGMHPVQGYVTGGAPIEWSGHQFSLFARKIRTAQQPAAFINDALDARELDVERWAATPADWVDFYSTRTNKHEATCYCSLDTVPAVVSACNDAHIPLPPRWRLAWWWRNEPGAALPDDVFVPYPTEAMVHAELARLTNIDLDLGSIWGCQFANYRRWDLSVIYGTPDFART